MHVRNQQTVQHLGIIACHFALQILSYLKDYWTKSARLFENNVIFLSLRNLLNVYFRIDCEEDKDAAIICVAAVKRILVISVSDDHCKWYVFC